MINKLNNIFQRITFPKDNNIGSNKTNYWLEKLFNQEKQKIEGKETLVAKNLHSSEQFLFLCIYSK